MNQTVKHITLSNDISVICCGKRTGKDVTDFKFDDDIHVHSWRVIRKTAMESMNVSQLSKKYPNSIILDSRHTNEYVVVEETVDATFSTGVRNTLSSRFVGKLRGFSRQKNPLILRKR
jgi:tRNA splicing ligase